MEKAFLSDCPYRCKVELLLPGAMMPLKSIWKQLEQAATDIEADLVLKRVDRDRLDAEFAAVPLPFWWS